ncbi:MAG: hypothetical protein HKN31_02125 [Pricia sp.]|nr:hypothetical protein [Pricia sp.]
MAKKVGILFGMEDTFPWAFIDKVNELGNGKVVAEAVQIDKLQQGIDYGYNVIFDRISQEVPFYRAYLKNAALMGTAVINNPFWWSADEKFFNNCLAMELGVPVPKTVLLPSKARPDNTSEKSFRNLVAPLDWDYIFNYIGFPAYMKPHDGGGWKNVYKVENADDLFAKHEETGQLVMMLQEEIVFEEYFRVYCLGQKYVHIMPYDPRKPFHERYVKEYDAPNAKQKKLLKTVHDYTLKLNKALGYDFNTVEFAVRDGVPYAIDFCNPAPDADIHSVGQANFDWIVAHSAKYAIEKANAYGTKQNNTSWGSFVKDASVSARPKVGKVNLKTVGEARKTAVKTPILPKSKAAETQKKKSKSTAETPAAKKAIDKKAKDTAVKKTPTKATVNVKTGGQSKTTAVKKSTAKSKTAAKTAPKKTK